MADQFIQLIVTAGNPVIAALRMTHQDLHSEISPNSENFFLPSWGVCKKSWARHTDPSPLGSSMKHPAMALGSLPNNQVDVYVEHVIVETC